MPVCMPYAAHVRLDSYAYGPIMLCMTFIPDRAPVRMCSAGAPERTLRDYVGDRMRACDERLKDGRPFLTHTAPFASWSRCMRTQVFDRPMSVQQWREMRTYDAVHVMITSLTAQPHMRAQAHTHTLLLADGSVLHQHDVDDRYRLAHVVAARRLARRMRRVILRSTPYGGTMTADGMSLNATNTANRLAPLDRCIALSDTYIAEHGTLTNVRFTRGAVRHDDGNVDSMATLHVAKVTHRRKGR